MKPSRRIFSLVQGPPEPRLRTWRPETAAERANAFLDRHPGGETVIAILILGGGMLAVFWCLYWSVR